MPAYTGNTLRILLCPSDPPSTTTTGPSAYIANGLVLRDQYLYAQNATTNAALAPQTLDYVSANDGTSNTLMLGENTQAPPTAAATAGALAKARLWSDVTSVSGGSGINPMLAQTFGFPLTTANNPTTSQAYYATALTGWAATYGTSYGGSTYTQYNGNPMTANINSAHSGGAVVVFFDGHSTFLRDDVGLNFTTGSGTVTVYQILVTPEGSKNGSEPTAPTRVCGKLCHPLRNASPPWRPLCQGGFLFS